MDKRHGADYRRPTSPPGSANSQAAGEIGRPEAYSTGHAPLRGIDGFAMMLEEDYSDKLDPEGRRYLSVIREASRRMGALIDDLLAFSRLGKQPVLTYEVDMADLVREVVGEVLRSHSGNPPEVLVGELPPAGQWVRLEVPAKDVGLDGRVIRGMSFTLFGVGFTVTGSPYPASRASATRPTPLPGNSRWMRRNGAVPSRVTVPVSAVDGCMTRPDPAVRSETEDVAAVTPARAATCSAPR